MATRLGLGVRVEPMRLGDIEGVQRVDALSFPCPWPAAAYRGELARAGAVYVVARVAPWPGDPLLPAGPDGRVVAGVAGLWLQVDQAHVSTLAVHPRYRRRHVAERLLVRVTEVALARRMDALTLEVRPSNGAALALYGKYGFAEAGRRKGYYSDNREDALILTTPPLSDPAWRVLFEARRRQVRSRPE